MIPAGYHDMKTTTKACGLSASIIRMWEARYGWPQPRRLPNGYRVYAHTVVEELKEVAVIVKAGTPIGKLVDKTGAINIPRVPKPPKRPVLLLASNVPEPETEGGKRARAELMEGFKTQDPGRILMSIAACLLVHPKDRAAACFAPACAALIDIQQEGKEIKKRDEIVGALALAIGGRDILQATMDTFLQYVTIRQEAAKA